MKLRTLVTSSLIAAAGCTDPGTSEGPGHHQPNPVTPVAPRLSERDQQQLELLNGQLDACESIAGSFAERHALPFATSLGYDPKQAENLSLIQASGTALTEAELDKLGEHGFVITDRVRFPTFAYGYETIYAQDLPLFVSADSILYALHKSYDAILMALEREALIPELTALLTEMRANIGSGGDADVDLYLAVAASLLGGEPLDAVAGASQAKIDELFAGAIAAQGMGSVTLFGNPRDVDFSQFEPRGHYLGDPQLERYFRAMMWLGRIDLRIIETKPDGSQVFQRRELEAALQLRAAMGPAQLERWQTIHDAIAGFVGQPDSMKPSELDLLLADLGVDAAGLASLSDETIADAVIKGGYGAQRIASQIMFAEPGADTLPLASSFLLFGQAYVIDSHVFSNLVFDRVGGGEVFRMLPNPLDVAYAALGNDQAASLIAAEVDDLDIAADFCKAEVLVDGHGEDYWSSSLYTLWLSALRTLSPVAAELDDPALTGIPTSMATEAWGRRVLNAQLASWAELRHDTLLYAKQSYTGGVSCEFPDAYVEPNPKFFAAIAKFAEDGAAIVDSLDISEASWLGQQLPLYFADLEVTATMLQGMAESQRSGTPFTEVQMAFINEAVHIQMGCGEPEGLDGWYARLFFDKKKGAEQDPTIADVHTQPTDEAGTVVGKVLHVATGLPRLMVVTADTCNGPRAYVGLASSYFEKVTGDFQRMNDAEWATELTTNPPADVPWMQDLVVR